MCYKMLVHKNFVFVINSVPCYFEYNSLEKNDELVDSMTRYKFGTSKPGNQEVLSSQCQSEICVHWELEELFQKSYTQ